MKAVFIITYIVLVAALVFATFFDLEITRMLSGEMNTFFYVLSDMAYVPPYVIGFFSLIYLYYRLETFMKRLAHRRLRMLFLVVGGAGMTAMFVRSMRHLPYFIPLALLMVLMMILLTRVLAKRAIHAKLYEFDRLAPIALFLIGGLFVSIAGLKVVIGRARPYLVFENEAFFSPWFTLSLDLQSGRDFNSTPSGHIAFATICLWVVLVAFNVEKFRVHAKKVTVVVLMWILLQTYLRILGGYHFITDAIFTILFTVAALHVLFFLALFITGLVERKRFGAVDGESA